MSAKKRLTLREYARAIFKVGVIAFKLAPSVAFVRFGDSIVQAVLPVLTTYFAARTTTILVDAYAGNAMAQRQAFIFVIVTVAISVVTLFWSSVNTYVSQKTRYKVEAAVEDTMMSHFSMLPFAMYDDKDTVDLHDKARRFSTFFSYIFDTIGAMVGSILGVIGAIISLIFVSPVLAVVVLIAVIPGLVVQLKLARQQARHWEGNITNRRRQGNLGWMLQEPRYIAEMRIYGVAKYLIKMHARLRDQDQKRRMEFELRAIWKQLAADIGETLVELGALVWITVQIISREQPVGQFVYVQQMVSRALQQAGALARQLSNTDQDLANIVDYQRFIELAEAPRRERKVSALPDTITVDNVSFSYPKTGKKVLQNVSFEIKRGRHIAIVGENGAGKSTLIKLLMGLYEPTRGSILLDGNRLDQFDSGSWHKYIALLGQEFISYYFATIKENIELGDVNRQFVEEDMKRAMKRAEFSEVVGKLEHGADTFIERWMAEDNDEATATELSGGQYQRLALARNFYRDSPIIILDEPTSAIDALAESRIFERLFAEKDRTIISISHRLTTIKKADCIYMLEGGKLVEQGTHADLIKQRGAYFHMFESQLHTD